MARLRAWIVQRHNGIRFDKSESKMTSLQFGGPLPALGVVTSHAM